MTEAAYRRALMAAIGLMAALILAFVLRGVLWPERLGPRLPAASGDTIWLESHGALHQFDAAGRRLKQLPLAELGMADTASALQFTAPDVFFTHDNGRVLRCSVAARRCQPIALPGLATRRDHRWMRVSADEREIVVSDASFHRVLVYQRQAAGGDYALARTYDQGLRFPNQSLTVNGRLWVANTNHHEIAQFDAQAAPGPAVAHGPVVHPALRPGRQYPFAMQRDDQQRLWVLVADPSMRHADLLQLDADLKPQRVIALTEQQDPNALLWVNGQMLVTDMTNFRVDRLAPDGRRLGTLDDATFLAELDAARDRLAFGKRLPRWLQTAIGVLMVLCLVLGWKAGEFRQLAGTRWRSTTPRHDHGDDEVDQASSPAATRRARLTLPSFDRATRRSSAGAQAASRAPTASAPLAGRTGIVTSVHALPGTTATRRRVLTVLALLHVATLIAMLYWLWPRLYQSDCGPDRACDALGLVRGALVLVVLALAAFHGLAWRHLKRLESLRIATDGHRIGVQWHGGRSFKVPATRATLTRRQLLLGRHAVPLRLNASPLFDEAALRRDILQRLPQMAVRDGTFDFGWLRHTLRFGGWRGWLAILLAMLAWLLIGWLLAVQLLARIG